MFKVGDIIIGNTDNTYAFTNKTTPCRVVGNTYGDCSAYGDQDLYVELVDSRPGDTFWVNSKYFVLLKEAEFMEFERIKNSVDELIEKANAGLWALELLQEYNPDKVIWNTGPLNWVLPGGTHDLPRVRRKPNV